ncbi:MAG TPA: phosphodiesterase [Candidatus Treponema faecavium]|nr:phosphodiesterase [Candidatus Treponema faecavium]
MKCLICSDIHGSAERAEQALACVSALGCDTLFVLGDVLYHGPRNPLPPGHDPKRTAALLNEYAPHIIACRGNCDAEVDQVMLSFPMLCDSALVFDSGVNAGGRAGRRLFLSHGHIWSPEKLPPLASGDVFLCGHTHIPLLYRREDGVAVCNPGSVSLPKGGSEAGIAVYDGERIVLCTLDGKPYKELVL